MWKYSLAALSEPERLRWILSLCSWLQQGHAGTEGIRIPKIQLVSFSLLASRFGVFVG